MTGVMIMQAYSKRILSIHDQIQSLKNSGLNITSFDQVKEALDIIGYYRLRGYSYQWYDNATKQYKAGRNFSDILDLYYFDMELSHLIFGFLSQIEVTIRTRFLNSILQDGHNALVLMDASQFKDKKLFWRNLSSISSEIARSNDVFIKHHYDKYEGIIPVWAAIEVISFGTLSKLIKNLNTGTGKAFSIFAEAYKYPTPKQKLAKPSQECLTSWIHSCSVLRNICAHNGRLYNRVIDITPEIISIDKISPTPKFSGIYQAVLAMKYLRPNEKTWQIFIQKLKALFSNNQGKFELNRLSFPNDWEAHM